MRINEQMAISRLTESGIKPSAQRIIIMDYLLSHNTHPTVEDVYQGVVRRLPTISRTTVYNTLRLFSEHKAAQMLTIDDHRVCYDGITSPHVHFLCRSCGRIIDLPEVAAPIVEARQTIGDNTVDEVQLYYKGTCATCRRGKR